MRRTHERLARALQKPRGKIVTTLILFGGGLAGSLVLGGVADPKAILGSLTAALSVAGLGYCFIDTVWGNNRPHLYSWLIWTIVNGVAWYNQWTHHAGSGAWSTLVMTVLSGMVFGASLYQYLRKISVQEISRMDQWCLTGALASIVLLILFKAGPLSIVAATIIDVFAFVPTLKKVWKRPHSETSVNYTLNTVRHIIALFAMQSYNFVTLLFPVSLVLFNALTVGTMLLRRSRLVPSREREQYYNFG